jgi:hypothetical protein
MDSSKIRRVRLEHVQKREDDRLHLLVLGAPRSGTTLLSSVIGFHPEVRMMIECKSHEHRQQIGGKVVGNKLCIPNQITLTPKPLSVPEYAEKFARWMLDRPLHPMTIRVYADKWDARFTPIVRNPDHVIHSMSNRGKIAETAKTQWSKAIETIHRICEEYPQRTHLVHFRKLVSDPERTTRKLSDFLDLKYHSRMLEGHGGAPWAYNRGKIDASVATKSVPNSNIEQSHPDAVRMYKELVAHTEENISA